MTRRVAHLSQLILLLFALPLMLVASASAHHPEIEASALCDETTGDFIVDYTSTAWEGKPGQPSTRENADVEIFLNGISIGSGAYEAPEFSFSDVVDAPIGSMPGDELDVTAVANAPWGNGNPGGQSTEITIFIPEGDCEPPPDIMIEKFTNGYDADDANGFPVLTPPSGDFVVGALQVPLVAVGEPVTWSYQVTNTGSETLVDVTVADTEGVGVSCPKDTLVPGESMTCLATAPALDLDTDPTATIVYGCGAQGMGTTQPTYENIGIVVGRGQTTGLEVSDEDPSHYCNPPDVMIEKFTNGHDGDDPNGNPDPAPGSFDPGAPSVAEIPSSDLITWTYRVTNNGPESLDEVMVSDSRGVDVTCPQDTLEPGETMICTATGSADDLATTGGDVDGCGSGSGETRPTYENLGSVVAQGRTSGVIVDDDDPSHYCNPQLPPECGLTVSKTCAVPAPPPGPDGKCDGRLSQFTMIWDGPDGLMVSGPANDAIGSVDRGDVVTFFGPFSANDVVVSLSGSVTGQSTFHTSCSDGDMDGATETNDEQQQVSSLGRDCGKFEGNGKGNNGNVNQWLLEGFVDDSGDVLDCTPSPTGGATSCEFTPLEASCDTLGKPSEITLLYSGGGCPGNNDQGSKADCSGSIDPGLPVTVTIDSGELGTVSPGGTFIVPTTGSNTTIELSNSGGTQTNDVHTSCSAPLVAGDSYGGMTLVALDGVGIGSDIVYEYLVSNQGDSTVVNISVSDDQLGSIGSIGSLAPGASATLSETAFISTTTTNIASVDGDGPPGSVCRADSNPVVVSVLPPPPCSASIAFKELKDDAVKWTLSNDGGRTATMETLQLDFPSGFATIKEVKLDGGIFKQGDSDSFPDGVAPGEMIGANDWTQDDTSKRQLDGGESRTLEVKFNEKFKSASPADFELTVTFEEGCIVDF